MALEDWTSISVLKSLVEDAKPLAEKRHFPNVGQYLNDAIRRQIEDDTKQFSDDPEGA